MAQPRHRVWLVANILPALEHLLELVAILSSAQHRDLTLPILLWAETCDVELAGLAHPCGAVEGAVGSHAPPQPYILLLRGSAADIGEIEVAQRPVPVRPICELRASTGHLIISFRVVIT
jgi:hypothetical protein